MTEYLKIIFMAVFQGIAEFLPISSSGHLELLGAVTGVAEDERFFLSVVLHAGTLISMLASLDNGINFCAAPFAMLLTYSKNLGSFTA